MLLYVIENNGILYVRIKQMNVRKIDENIKQNYKDEL